MLYHTNISEGYVLIIECLPIIIYVLLTAFFTRSALSHCYNTTRHDAHSGLLSEHEREHMTSAVSQNASAAQAKRARQLLILKQHDHEVYGGALARAWVQMGCTAPEMTPAVKAAPLASPSTPPGTARVSGLNNTDCCPESLAANSPQIAHVRITTATLKDDLFLVGSTQNRAPLLLFSVVVLVVCGMLLRRWRTKTRAEAAHEG